MNRGNAACPRGQWLLLAGVLLLLAGLLNGFFVHGMALPRLALAAHLEAIMGGTLMIALGLAWPQLGLTPAGSAVGQGLAVYGFGAGWLTYLLASARGAGGMFPLAAGQSRGTPSEEAFVTFALATVAAALIGLCLLLLWGLRRRPTAGAAAGALRRHDAKEKP